MQRATIAGLLVVGLFAVGCSARGAAEANAALCASLTRLSDELQTLGRLSASNATVQEMQVQVGAVESADDVDGAMVQQVSAAAATFAETVGAIPGAATLAEAAVAHGSAAGQYTSTVETALGDLGCS